MSILSRDTHLDALPLRNRVRKRLKCEGIWYLEDFAHIAQRDLQNLHGIGFGTLNFLTRALATVGLQWPDGISDRPSKVKFTPIR